METLIISAGIALVSSLIAAGKEAEAAEVRKKVAAKIGAEKLPEFDKAVAQEVKNSEFANIKEDPALRGQATGALDKLGAEYDTGGMAPADLAALRQAQGAVGANVASNYGSMMQSFARRGLKNSGLEAALMSQAGQDNANAIGNQAVTMQVAGRNRALDALNGQLAGARGVRSDDYRKSSDAANAMDVLNRFNATQRTNASQVNNQWAQQGYDNAMRRNADEANALNGVAAGYDQAGANIRQTGGGVANAVFTYGREKERADAERAKWGSK